MQDGRSAIDAFFGMIGNPARFWVHCNPNGQETRFFEILSESDTGEPFALGEPCNDSDAIAILIGAGVPSITAAAAVSEARRAGVAGVAPPGGSSHPERTWRKRPPP